jgi:F0F1-type ATP synthase membrane subunit b/b'
MPKERLGTWAAVSRDMRFLHILLASALCLPALGACSEKTREKTKDAAHSAGQDIRAGTAKAVEKTKEVGRKADDAIDEAGSEIREKAGKARDKIRAAGHEAKEDANQVKDTTKRAVRETGRDIRD